MIRHCAAVLSISAYHPYLPTAPPDRELAHALNLIRHTGELVKHQRELERVTGEHFNLFHILRIGHYEVSTHSPPLGDLLDLGLQPRVVSEINF